MKCKTINTIAGIMLSAIGTIHAAQVDLGITLGTVLGNSGVINNARVELGTFSLYTDSSGSSYFSGKDYTTLRGAFTSLLEVSTPQVLGTDSLGQFYGSFDTGTTGSGTRLFAWIFSTSTVSSSGAWAVISGGGTGPNDTTYNPVWLAVAPTAVDVNVIEAATTYTQIYASTPGASLVSSTSFDPEGANISLVPEPSTGALLMIGSVGLVALRRLRKV